jgi:hypothetical protein
MARKVSIDVVVDPTLAERGFKRTAVASAHFRRELQGSVRGALSASGAFEHLGRSLAFASGGFVAFASAGEFLRKSVDAARDAGVAQKSLAAQLKASGETFKANKVAIDRAGLSLEKFGFTTEDSAHALTVLERGTGKISQALRLQGVVADLARAKNIGLSDAALIVAKVFGGQETALRRAVPGLEKNAHGLDLIREAGQKLSGQARANTTESQRFSATLHDSEVIIGTALLPTIDHYLESLGKWLDKMNRSGRLQRDVNQAVKTGQQVLAGLEDVVKPLIQAFKLLGDALGGTKNEVELLVGAFVAFKTAKILTGITNVAGGISGIGTAAGTAAGEVGALNTKVGILARLNPLALIAGLSAADLVLGHKALTTGTAGGFGAGRNGSPYQKGSEEDDIYQATRLGKKPKGIRIPKFGPSRAAFILGQAANDARIRSTNGGSLNTNRVSIPKTASGFVNGRLSADQARVAGLAVNPDSIPLLRQQLAHDRAALAFAKKLLDENRITNANYVKAVITYGDDLNQTLDHITSLTKAAAKKAFDGIKRVRVPDNETIRGSTNIGGTRLFRDLNPLKLGGAHGAFQLQQQNFAAPPGIALALAKAGITARSTDDARALNSLRSAAFKALRSGRLSIDAKIDAYNAIASVDQQLAGLAKTSISTLHAASTRALTAGLNLSRVQRLALESRLAQSQAHGGRIGTSTAAFGTVVNVNGPVYANDVKGFTEQMHKKARRSSAQTRGGNAGTNLGYH